MCRDDGAVVRIGLDDDRSPGPHRGEWHVAVPTGGGHLRIGGGEAVADIAQRDGGPLLVRIARAARGHRPPIATTELELEGPHLVLTTVGGVRAPASFDPATRARIAGRLAARDVRVGWGLRRAAADASDRTLDAEADALVARWHEATAEALRDGTPRRVVAAPPVAVRFLLDAEPGETVVVDHPRDADALRRATEGWGGAGHERWRLFEQRSPAFVREGFEPAIRAALASTVRLDSGLRLHIEPTEAVVAVDVDAGDAARRVADPRQFARVQAEAMPRLVRELDLRDLAGVLVVDLVGGGDAGGEATRALREALAERRGRSRVLGCDDAGLLRATIERGRTPWWAAEGPSWWRDEAGSRRAVGRIALDATRAALAGLDADAAREP